MAIFSMNLSAAWNETYNWILKRLMLLYESSGSWELEGIREQTQQFKDIKTIAIEDSAGCALLPNCLLKV